MSTVVSLKGDFILKIESSRANTTRNKLYQTAIKQFKAKGYDDTSIKEIANCSGYSVGSFYKHWKSKEMLFREVWDNFCSEFMKNSVENAPNTDDPSIIIDYLLERSQKFSNEELTKKLFLTSHAISASYEYEKISYWAEKYTALLYDFLTRISKTSSEEKITTTANMIHCILNTHAIQSAGIQTPTYTFHIEALKECLLDLMRSCK